MRLIASDDDALELPAGHRFPAGKYARIQTALVRRNPSLTVRPARASWEDLALVHEPRYLTAVREGALPVVTARALGLPWSESLVARARRSVGGTLAALDWALELGVAGHLAGGTHHAFRDRGAGFCVFNDVAVAAAVARRDHDVRRVAIVDLDVHQGDGTAAVFADDAEVFTLSLHGDKNFPFRKEKSSLDVGLPDGTEDEPYLRALDEALERVGAHRPELVVYQAGVDALAGDRFGRLALTHAGLAARDRRVFGYVRGLGVPLLVTLGGGYHPQIEQSIAAHVAVFEGMLDAFRS